MGSQEVTRAQARLAEATARAQAAQLRLETARRYHEGQQVRRRGRLLSPGAVWLLRRTDDGALASLRTKAFEWVSTGRVGLKPLWLEFVSMGGECGILEFDAYVHGALQLCDRDQSVLEQVCWELESFGTPGSS